jgi:FemAB-related protein (PEP-CTERM system-associated)
MSTSIRKQLRSNPENLLDTLTAELQSPELKAAIKKKLDEIGAIMVTEKEKLEQRQQLSRKIGQAKKANEDSSGLIARVSALSAEIDTLKQKIDSGIDAVELEISDAGGSDEHEQSTDLPLHLKNQLPDNDQADKINLTTHHESIDTIEWQSFVDTRKHATIYHDPRWQSIVENYFNHNYYSVSCRDQQGNLIGTLPLVHVKSKLFGSFTISMPYFNYGGPLAEHPQVEEALLNHAAELSKTLGCEHMEIRETKARGNWASTQRKVSMILPLPASDELLDKQLGSKLRAQVKKAESNELIVEFGSHELLDNFYTVFARNMRDLGTPVYGKKLFSEILSKFPDSAFISVVKQHGNPLAAGFLLGYNDKLEIPWASSIRSKNHLGANMFMYRNILREAIDRKYDYFDFGRSTIDASTHRFKKQWGAVEHQLHWHYWTKGGETPSLNPDNPKFKLAIMVWQRLPVFVTKIIGPPLARNLP